MTRIPGLLMVALCALLCAFPAAAAAGRLTIPPNQPEADEYTPSVPDGEGNSSPDRTRDPEDVLDQDLLDQLDQLGDTGSNLALLAASTAPGDPGSGPGSGSGSGSGPGSGSAAGDAGGSAQATLAEVGNVNSASYVPSEDGLGTWLWVIVVIAVVSAALYALYLWMSGRRA